MHYGMHYGYGVQTNGFQTAQYNYGTQSNAYAGQYSHVSRKQFLPVHTVPAPNPETTYASSSKPWGKPDIGAFLKRCAELTPIDGRNWGKYKFDLSLHTRSYGVKGFIDVPASWELVMHTPQLVILCSRTTSRRAQLCSQACTTAVLR